MRAGASPEGGIKTGPPAGSPETSIQSEGLLVVIRRSLLFLLSPLDRFATNGTFLQQRAEWPLKSSAAKTLSSKGVIIVLEPLGQLVLVVGPLPFKSARSCFCCALVFICRGGKQVACQKYYDFLRQEVTKAQAVARRCNSARAVTCALWSSRRRFGR